MVEPEIFLRVGMDRYMQVSVRSIVATHSPFLREACIDSGVSILNFGMARNLFSELKSITGLQRMPGFGTRNSRL